MLHLGAVVHTFLCSCLADVFLLDLWDCCLVSSTDFVSVISFEYSYLSPCHY